MPWRCATNCATARVGHPLRGDGEFTQRPRRPPNPMAAGPFRPPQRGHGGGVPSTVSAPEDAFHVWRRHPSRALDELGPVRVAQRPEDAPRDVRRRARAATPPPPARRRRASRARGTPPAPTSARCSVSPAPTRAATSAQGLPAPPRRTSSPRASAAWTSGQPSRDLGGRQALPGPDVDLAEAARRSRRAARRRAPPPRPSSAPGRGRWRRGAPDAAPRGAAQRPRPGRPRGSTARCRGGPARCRRRCGRSPRAAGRRRAADPWRSTAPRGPARLPASARPRGHRPPCSVPTTPRSTAGQSFQRRSSS